MDKPTKPRGKRSVGKQKVKSGCQTCRIRKVKCDETFPVCHRCTSTGRTCEGYGIWGGGGGGSPGLAGSTITIRPRPLHLPGNTRPGYGSITGPLYSPACHYPMILDAGDKARFEWFRYRSAPKLPGTFVTGFWTKLVFQAASTEPSVLHGILALGTAHRTPILNDDTAASQEFITLQHYTKAIGHLQYHLAATSRASLHVSLIGCVIFICLELLRGHLDTAQRHMDNGWRVLAEAQASFSTDDTTVRSMHQPRAKMLDGWIVEIFSRLRLQFRLFHQSNTRPCFEDPAALCMPMPSPRFHSTNEAWKHLGQLLDKAIDIANEARRSDDICGGYISSADDMIKRQKRNRADLSQWLAMFNISLDTIRVETAREDERVKLYLLMLQYYTMAEIMTATSISTSRESIYDSQTSKFICLIENAITLAKTSSEVDTHQSSSSYLVSKSLSISDMGWIAPLYYTAIKCRVHRIRHHAIRLLSTSDHKEGIWDSKTSLCIARKVVELEEESFSQGPLGNIDEFPLFTAPTEQDLSLPNLPECHRIRNIDIELHGGPLDSIKLTCSQRRDGVDRTVFVGEYHVASQEWESTDMD